MTFSKIDPELTTVPEMSELDRVRSKLAALRDGLREPSASFNLSLPPTSPGTGGGDGGGDDEDVSSGGGVGDGEGTSGPARLLGPDEWRRHPRWERWGEGHPPCWVYSPPGCPLENKAAEVCIWFRLVGWLSIDSWWAGWLDSWWAGRLVGRMVGQLVGCSIGWAELHVSI